LSSSVLHLHTEAFKPISATFLLLKAKSTVPADLSLVETADGQRHLSFLSLSFGLIADVDLESEVIRWAGSLRMDLFSFYAILRLRTYRARFSFLPCEEGGTPPGEAVELPPLHMPLPEKDGSVSMEDDFLMVRGNGKTAMNSRTARHLPLTPAARLHRFSFSNKHTQILISHVSHIAETVHSSPGKKIGDGTFQILVLRQQPSLSRLRLISLFLALEHGGHVAVSEVEVYDARAYRLEPLTEQGRYSLDGEAIPYGNVQGRVLPHAIQLLGDL
jgi:sphingosine kinase